MAKEHVHDLGDPGNCQVRDDLNVNLDINNKRLAYVAETVAANHKTMIEVGSVMRILAGHTLRLAIAVEKNNELIARGIEAQSAATAEAISLRNHMENESTPAVKRLSENLETR